ncbi:MAG: hypothetical protein K0R26_2966 [Bacteroidota bacterium]|jgi:hypothetical protein|nr:hypothetical protein [Bacteroidota bacterium]
MKKIFLSLFILSSAMLFSQASVCGQFHRKYCGVETKHGKSDWLYNAQSKSGLFNMGSTSKIRCVIYKGMDYRINVCCESALGEKLNYKIFDARTSELLYDNATAQNASLFEFQSTASRQLIIEVSVPNGATSADKHKPMEAACVGLLIEHKVTDRQGFSQY